MSRPDLFLFKALAAAVHTPVTIERRAPRPKKRPSKKKRQKRRAVRAARRRNR